MSELGHALRTLRLNAKLSAEEIQVGYKRVTQELLAERLGWSNAAHVSQIENGLRMPQAETIQRWVSACGGTDPEAYYLLGLAGYMPITQLPPREQFIPILEQVDLKTLSKHPYPAYAVDYQTTLWMANSMCALFVDAGDSIQEFFRIPINLYHLMFDPRLPIRNKIINLEETINRQMTLFKMFCMLRQHEPFYKRFVEETSKKLLPENAIELRQVWDANPLRMEDFESLHEEHIVMRFPPDVVVTFNITAINIFNVRDLFTIVQFEPNRTLTSPENMEALEALCEPMRGKPSARLWEEIEVDVFMSRYL
jgi:transcriptional regulator with XRE-family HTH domain